MDADFFLCKKSSTGLFESDWTLGMTKESAGSRTVRLVMRLW